MQTKGFETELHKTKQKSALYKYRFKRHIFSTRFLYIFLIFHLIVCVFPLVWMTMNSFKKNNEIFSNPWGLPQNFTLEGYIAAFTKGNVPLLLYNSIFVAVMAGAICIVLSLMASYAIQRMKWKLSKVVLAIFLIGLMIPVHSIVLPLYMTFTKIGLTNSRWGLILPYIVTSIPNSILIFTGFLESFPVELEEAAIIDGCSLMRIFLQIVTPLLKPAIATVLIFNFISMWNEMFLALVIMAKKELYTLPLGALRFNDLHAQNYTPMFAFLTLTIVISVTFYIVFQKWIVSGLTAGAIKG